MNSLYKFLTIQAEVYDSSGKTERAVAIRTFRDTLNNPISLGPETTKWNL